MARPGTWDFDADDDFLLADGMESQVGLQPLLADGTYGPAYFGHGCREVPSRRSSAMVEQVDLIWHLHAADYPRTSQINRGDVITDSCGVKWIVLEAKLGGVQDQWICNTIKSTESP